MQEVILEHPETLGEALRTITLLQNENDFLKRQLEVAQTFQARMGLTLNRISIGELFDKKIMEVKAMEQSKGSIKRYQDSKYYFLKWCKTRGMEYAEEVTYDHTNEFWEWFKVTPGLSGRILGKSRRIILWKVIKATFQYAEERNSIIKNTFKNKVFPLSPVEDWWDDEYVENLIIAIRKYGKPSVRHRYETIVRLLITTGIRVGILLNIRHEKVKVVGDRVFATFKLKIPTTSEIQEHTIEIMNGKAKKMFLCYYNEGKTGYMLCGANPSSGANVFRQALIKYICPKAGIPYKIPHKAKHGFVTKLLENGVTSVQICKLTGNRSTRIIEKTYNHVQSATVREKVRHLIG